MPEKRGQTDRNGRNDIMIQDIAPEHLDNSFHPVRPQPADPLLCFREGKAMVRYENGRLLFPSVAEMPENRGIYLFSVAGRPFFLNPEECPGIPGYELYSLSELRGLELAGNLDLLVVYTGFHLWSWYGASRFCGSCGTRTVPADDERAMVCPACGKRIYPRINPAVIVGVINGERLLITKYRTGFAHHALIAGFTEIGETAEQTVEREVMEEVGLRVRNIRYYKSQPWGIASDLLMGFYCEVDGDTAIHRDEKELGYAEWVQRDQIILQPSDYSLTNEMMKQFRDGKIH